MSRKTGLFRSIGPAFIVACVVLGPGSILSSTKVGATFGYDMVWVLVVAGILMIGMTALSARLGVLMQSTPCAELAQRAGRWLAVLTGSSLFLIVACFQFGNNVGVLASIQPLFELGHGSSTTVLVLLNMLVVVALFGFRKLYDSVEKLLMVMVGLMIVGFMGNLVLAQPSIAGILGGLVPQLPANAASTIIPKLQDGKVVDNLRPVVAMIATTFSVGGAFYQAYLVRQKGWTKSHLRQGLIDSATGIGVLGLITLTIMVTSAAVFFGNPDQPALESAADIAIQLKPLFGQVATALFCLGIFAAAFSSLFVNAIIGGSVMSDGLGLGGEMDRLWPKLFTVFALLVGMVVAIAIMTLDVSPVELIIFAQAITVIALPLLAGVMLWLATRPDLSPHIPLWMKLNAWVGFLLTLFLALRNGIRLYLQNFP